MSAAAVHKQTPLAGKIALVTGAGTGIGRETALLLAGAGAVVVLVGRRREVLEQVHVAIEAAGGSGLVYPGRVENSAEMEAVVGAVAARFGGIDILVNNAGMGGRTPNVRWTPEEEWNAVMAVNMTAVYRLTQLVLPGMLSRGGGSIVTISSLAALRPNLLGGAAYGAAKAAVRNFMTFLHNTFRNDLVRATCIMPGETSTPIMDSRARPPTAAERDMMMHPEDVAGAVLFCCTLPQRTVVEEIAIAPTRQRDISADLDVARRIGEPDEGQS